MQLEDGTYKSELTEASLIDELRAALGPHAKIDSSHRRVMVDTTVLRLLLHEVSTNAAKYSPSQKQISARAKLEQGRTTARPLDFPCSCAGAHAVRNAVLLDRPLPVLQMKLAKSGCKSR